MITIPKAILSGAAAEQIRDRARELAPGHPAASGLHDLAAELAAHRDLRVSMIIYEDGSVELEVLHTGPPHHNENTIDPRKFAGQAPAPADRTLSIAGESGIQDAANIVRAILHNASTA